MRKFLVITFLLMTSFFSFNFVKADMYEKNLEYDITLLDNPEFAKLKEETEKFVASDEELSDNFIIVYYTYNNGNSHAFYSLLGNECAFNFSFNSVTYRDNNTIYLNYHYSNNPKCDLFRYKYDGSSLSKVASLSGFIQISSSSPLYLYTLLYSSLDITLSPKTHIVNLHYTYKDYTSDVTFGSSGNKFLTVSDFKEKYDKYVEETSGVHEKELSTIGLFYLTLLNKLSFLAISFSSNYIYLSIVVISLLIFLAFLIRRWLL